MCKEAICCQGSSYGLVTSKLFPVVKGDRPKASIPFEKFYDSFRDRCCVFASQGTQQGETGFALGEGQGYTLTFFSNNKIGLPITNPRTLFDDLRALFEKLELL